LQNIKKKSEYPGAPAVHEKLYHKGLSLLKTAHREKAKAVFNSIKATGPLMAQVYSCLGEIHHQMHQDDDAEKYFLQALKINKTNPDARFYYSMVLNQQDKSKKMNKLLLGLTKTSQYNSIANYVLAYLALRAGKYAQAEKYIIDSLKTNPENLKSYFLHLICLRKERKYNEAYSVLEKAVALDPTSYLFRSEHKILTKESALPVKLQKLPELVSLEYDELSINTAIEYMNCKLLQDAYFILTDALKLQKTKTNPLFYYTLGYILNATGQKEEAKKYFKTASEINSTYFMPYRYEIISIMEVALTANPKDGMGYYHYGNMLFAADRFDEAIDAWKKAVLLLNNTNATVYRNLGMAYSSVKADLLESVKYYRKAVAIDPLDCRLYHELDEIYSELDMHHERTYLLESAPKKIKNHPKILKRWAYLYCGLQEYEKGIKLLEVNRFAFSEGGYDTINLYKYMCISLGKSLCKQKKYRKAITCFHKSVWYPSTLGIELKFVHNLQGLYELGKACLQTGEKQKAKQYWQKITKSISITGTHMRYYQALAYQQLGKPQEAQKIFNELIVKNTERQKNREVQEPLSAGEKSVLSLTRNEKEMISYLYYVKGLGYLGQNNRQKAKENFVKSINKYPHLRWAQAALDELLQEEV